MRTYTVPLKIETEEPETRHGVLAVPESLMGKDPVYVYRDVKMGDFFPSTRPPAEMSEEWFEYIVTVYPRDHAHLTERVEEIAAWHTGKSLTTAPN